MNRTKKVWEKVSKMNIPRNFTLGPIYAESLLKDPKHLAFTLSRYKFAAKMMKKCKHIIEVGCGEGIGTFMFLSDTSAIVTGIDFDNSQIAYANQHVLPYARDRLTFICQNLVSTPYSGNHGDGLVGIDVIEHIHPSEEKQFLQNCVACLDPEGTALFGTPNKYADKYASDRSKHGHINLFDAERLTATLDEHFKHVFLFSMNDEMVHTGYNKLAHYLIALCVR